MDVYTRRDQVNEILACGKDAVYFMRNYAKIQHPKRGLIPFETFTYQDDCVKAFDEHRFNVVLKARQLGLSTVTAAYATWLAIFHKDKNILVIATKLTTAMNFIKKVRTILDGLPKWLLLTKFEPTKQSISFSNGSVVTAIPTSPDAGRSEALSLLIVDEAAFIRDFEDIWTGLYPTLSTGGAAIILSTPNGVGGQYYKLWSEAESGVNEFNPIKLMWDVHPECDQAWFDKETKNLPKRKIAQEYECDFVSSGDTFLQPEDLEHLRKLIKQPIEKTGPQMNVWIWKKPEPLQKYVISADVSRGDSNDYSTFHIINYNSCEIVAEYMGKIPPDKLADLLAEYGKMYNTALLCPEQNTFGYFTAIKLRDAGYPSLYYEGSSGDLFEHKQSNPDIVPGFSTQKKSREQILAKLEELIRNKILLSSSQRLYNQLQAFVWNGSKAQASKDAHDDLVISIAIGTWLTNGNTTNITQGSALAHAILKATCVIRRGPSDLPGNLNEAQALVNPNIRGANSNKNKRPNDKQNSRNFDITDYSWLLR